MFLLLSMFVLYRNNDECIHYRGPLTQLRPAMGSNTESAKTNDLVEGEGKDNSGQNLISNLFKWLGLI